MSLEIAPHEDRLIHLLLREELAGQTPPDLTMKVLLAGGAARARWMRWAVPAAAAAAIVLVAGLIALLAGGSYVAVEAHGDYRIVEGGALDRGAVIAAGAREAQLNLGGYCQVQLASGSTLELQGRPRGEEVFLRRGQARCKVNRNVGTFTVQSDVGSVSVSGTEFTVRVTEGQGDDKMFGKTMWVKVLAGAVVVTSAMGTATLQAGDERSVTGGRVTGVVVDKGDNWIQVKDDSGKSERYTPRWLGGKSRNGGGPDKDTLGKIHAVAVGTRIELIWTRDQYLRVLDLRPVPSATTKPAKATSKPTEGPDNGAIVGTIEDKGDVTVAIKSGGKTETYMPRYLAGEGGKGGHLDYDMLHQIAVTPLGATVQINWLVQDKTKRIEALKVVPRGTTQPTSEPAAPEASSQPSEKVSPSPAASSAPKPDVFGTIVSVGSSSMTLQRPNGDQTVVVTFNDATNVNIGGSAAKTSDLKVGMHAAVCVKEGKPATEIRAYMPKPSSTANPATGGNFREGQSGSLAGTVLEKTETSITVKTDGDSPQTLTFIPKWVGLDPDQGGGFNKDMLAAIKATAVKSRVQVQWVFQEHLRVVQLMVGSRP